MSRVLPRSAWTSRNPKSINPDVADEIDGLPNFQDPLGIVLHWAGSRASLVGRSSAEIFRTVQSNDMDNKKYADIMYNGGGGWEGTAYDLRGIINKGAANGSTVTNGQWASYIFLLGPTDKLTLEMLSAYAEWRSLFLAKYPQSTAVTLHQKLKATACPGPEIVKFYEEGVFNKIQATPPPPFNCDLPNAPLYEGMRHLAVGALQNYLAFFGWYQGPVDGIYGPVTRWGVAAMQKELIKANLFPYTVDGQYGHTTRAGFCKFLEGLSALASK